jgi:hypothetical protein
VNRETGLPEHAVISMESLRYLQCWAVKGLFKELNTKCRPEEIVTILNRASQSTFAQPGSPLSEAGATSELNDTPMKVEQSNIPRSSGIITLSGIRHHITDFPFVIGSDEEECSLVIPPTFLSSPILPIHCVIDRKTDSYTIEAFGECSVEGVKISPATVASLSPAATLTIGGVLFSFFPSE